MYTLKLKKIDSVGVYLVDKNSSNELSAVAEFFGDNVCSFSWLVRETLVKQDSFCFNSAGIIRKENEATIFCFYDDSEFKMSFDKFMDLLNQWEKVYQQAPKEIIITIDDEFNCTVAAGT